MGAQHMVLNEEQVAFSDWMNNNLGSDKDVNHLLPLNVRNMIYLSPCLVICRCRSHYPNVAGHWQ